MMKPSELNISQYLKDYYHLKDDNYQVEQVDPRTLLVPMRLDLGAKLYYIQARMEGRSMTLAQALYRRHIVIFSSGYVREAGKHEKLGIDCYQQDFDRLIDVFAQQKFDPDRELIPVDRRGVILDGAHRLACAVYFNTPVKIVRLHTVQGYNFDCRYFYRGGLERGYLELMAAGFSRFQESVGLLESAPPPGSFPLYVGKDRSGRVCSLVCGHGRHQPEQIEAFLGIPQKEAAEDISVPFPQRCRSVVICSFRYCYVRLVIALKELLHLPT